MNNSFVLETFRKMGAILAEKVQQKAPDMTNTELCAETLFIPTFEKAKEKMNMLQRPVGFVCISPAGRVVRLLQPYDSDTYGSEPELLPAQWGFAWSTDPAFAREFISLATSPYNTGECCIEGGKVYRSKIDGNVHAPSTYPDGWEVV